MQDASGLCENLRREGEGAGAPKDAGAYGLVPRRRNTQAPLGAPHALEAAKRQRKLNRASATQTFTHVICGVLTPAPGRAF
jgi:hypothetical protein